MAYIHVCACVCVYVLDMCKSMNTFLSVRANRGAEPCAFILREADEYLRALKAENDTLHQVVCKQLSQCKVVLCKRKKPGGMSSVRATGFYIDNQYCPTYLPWFGMKVPVCSASQVLFLLLFCESPFLGFQRTGREGM